MRPMVSLRRRALLGLLLAGSVHADPLKRAARPSPLASQRLLLALAPVGGDRLVAVGQRGHVLLSADGGGSWTQAMVPVSSDLTALQFVDAQRGYAVGHDGVVLRSDDGGQTWRVVLDGQRANALALAQLQEATPEPNRDHDRLLAELQRNVDAGPDKPLLDLHFNSADEGFVVGAYNLIFHTRDGGQSWQSWYQRSDNRDQLLNLHAIRAHRGELFVVGEAGLLMRLDAARRHWVRVETGYNGSFFGLLDAGDALMAHGMRGQAVISRDSGRTWAPLATGLQASITASARGADGSVWLADQMGRLSLSRIGQGFQSLATPAGMPVAALHVSADRLVVAGPRGARRLPLPKE